MKKNDLCEIRIEDMGKDGEGIGHVDGMTIFVKDTVVGDRATVKLMKVKKNMAFARLMEILEPSPYRVTPVCEAARACGGCTLQHISYEKQKELKQSHVLNCLTRIGGLSDVEEKMEPLIGMEDPFHYRNKLQFPVGLDAVLRRKDPLPDPAYGLSGGTSREPGFACSLPGISFGGGSEGL